MKKGITIIALFFLMFVLAYIYYPSYFTRTLDLKDTGSVVLSVVIPSFSPQPHTPTPVSHIKTPSSVKALYMTSWVAGTKSIRDKVVALLDETEANALVIDIKDYTGKIAFLIDDPDIIALGSAEKRIADITDLIEMLHKKNIYVIGRVAVFQDPFLVAKRPELAVRRKSDGGIWKDRKGISWIDAGSSEAWDYAALIARKSYELGFDEINFDYVRFPSDGNMADISYEKSAGRTKAEVIKDFFDHLHQSLKTPEKGSDPDAVPVISVDLFGLTTSAKDDLGIGQILENALPNFDFIDPMIYPSHYASGFQGYKNPAEHPYEVIHYALSEAIRRSEIATSSPSKIRPWLQDFDLGATYTKEMVRAQIQATYDVGLTSWLMWDPSNVYTSEALLKE